MDWWITFKSNWIVKINLLCIVVLYNVFPADEYHFIIFINVVVVHSSTKKILKFRAGNEVTEINLHNLTLIVISWIVLTKSGVSLLCPDFFLCCLSVAYFTELHGQSERLLQEVLSPLGPLYSQNARLFAELYADLRQYYRGSALHLDENLSEFWSQLLERTFKASALTEVSTGICPLGPWVCCGLKC